MKQSTKRIFAAALAALVVAAAGTTLTTQLPQLTNSVAHADTVKENDTAWAESGVCSEDEKMRYSIGSGSDTLTISVQKGGSGIMKDYSDENPAPWNKYKDKIKEVEIKGDVKSIGNNAFKGCSNLTTIIMETTTPPTLGADVFSNCPNLSAILVPNDALSAYQDPANNWPNEYITIKDNESATITWSINPATGVLTLSGTGKMTDYASEDALPWKDYRDKIKRVVIEPGIESIGKNAFCGCAALTTITVAENSKLESIGKSAFQDCTALTAVNFAESSDLKTIDQNAFRGCTDLTTVTFAESGKLTGIWEQAFLGCQKLESIAIPASVTTLGDRAFQGCTALATATFAEGSQLKVLGNSVFAGCTALERVHIPASIEDIRNAAFSGCTALERIRIPEKVTSIGESALQGCTSLTTIIMEPLSPPKVGRSACPNLSTILVSVNALPNYQNACDNDTNGWNRELKPKLAVGGFCGATANDTVTWELTGGDTLTISGKGKTAGYGNLNNIPWKDYKNDINKIVIEEGVESIGAQAFYGYSELATVNFAENGKLETVGSSAFKNCGKIEAITIPASVKMLGNDVFSGCSELATVNFAENSQLETVGSSAFKNCGKIEAITIPASVKMLDSYVFSGCTGLISIEIPNSVTSIGNRAFHECTGLTTVDFAENSKLETIDSEAFYSCKKLKAITIPASVKTIDNDAFYNCIALTTVTFAENSQLETIGQRAFSNCVALESIHIPAGVTSIQSYTFSGCTALATVTLSPKATMIQDGAFSFCSGLKELVIPRSVTEIGASAFQGSGLMRVTIPAAVKQIGRAAFSDCDNLDEVIMEDTQPPTIEAVVFGSDAGVLNEAESKFVKENTKGITVPYGSLSAYQQANGWDTYKNYMKEAPAPVSPAPSTDPVTVQKPTTIDENGNTITGSITTYPDGSVVDTTIVTKPNGDTTTTVVEKDPKGNTTKTTETKVETAADGTKTETETVTEAGKAPVITKTVTKKDGSQTIEKITSAENSRGNTVTTTETTVKDSKGNVVKKTTKKEIKNIGNGTDAIIDVDNNTAIINKIGAAKPKGMQATINNKVLSQLKEANNGKDLLLTMIVKDKDGNKRYSVEVNTADLTPKNKLYIYKKDSKTGELILVNNKAYITDSKGQLKLIIRSKGNFVLKNAEDAAKINEKDPCYRSS